jgi:hypothetical protein
VCWRAARGRRVHRPAIYTGRRPENTPLCGIPTITPYPYTGSAIYIWDGGPLRESSRVAQASSSAPDRRLFKLPNRSSQDPHELPRNTVAEQQPAKTALEATTGIEPV